MAAEPPWLYAELCKQPGVFGKFEGCLTFRSEIQSAPSGLAGSAASSGQPSSERNDLQSEQDVHTYLDGLEKAGLDVCIVAFISDCATNGKLPLPLSRTLFEHVARTFDIPPTFLTVLNSGVARYKIGREWGQAQFIIQQNRSYLSYSIALTFDLQTGKVRALIFGTEKPLSDLFDYLKSLSPLPFGPMTIPTIALELQAKRFNDTINTCQNDIHDIENLTGMRQFNHPYEGNQTQMQDWKSLDLIDVTRNLSGFLSRFAHLHLQAETGAYLIHQMQLSAEFLIAELEKMKEEKSKIDSQHDILSKLKDIESWFVAIQARCRYLTRRTWAQTQTVYNLISSQNSEINILIARASHDIAEVSRKNSEALLGFAKNSRCDTRLMLQIAQNSGAVAVSTAKDNAAMRVIAGVTIIFLPATFIATFLSMPFFDFTGDADAPRTSPWIWIYVLATVFLTIVIQTVWAILSKAKLKQLEESSDSVLDIRNHVDRLEEIKQTKNGEP